MADKLTPWFPPHIKPVRVGLYRAQDTTMRCNCCHIYLHWDGEEWHSDMLTPGRFRTYFFKGHLRRWRGLSQPTKD